MWRYVATDELYHYGVLGMKWGVRRYQNEDGTLTSLGKDRYGGKQEYADNPIRKIASSSLSGSKHMSKFREHALDDKIRSKSFEGKDTRKLEEKREAQKAANDNLEAYTRRTSTAKLIMQNALMTSIGGHIYREARARGETRFRSLLESSLMAVPVVGIALRYKGNKKAYGQGLVLSGMKDGDVL